MNIELASSIMVNVVAIAFFAGTLKATQDHQKQIINLLREEFSEHFKRLEEKQNKHNSVIERQFKTESDIEVLYEKVDVANHRIEDLEDKRW